MLRRRRRQDRLALLLRERVGQRHPQRELSAGLPDGAAAPVRDQGHRRVRARLREPRHGRGRFPQEPPEGQGRPGRRPRHPHQRDRETGADCRPHPEGARPRPGREGHAEHGLRYETPGAYGREDEAEGAG